MYFRNCVYKSVYKGIIIFFIRMKKVTGFKDGTIEQKLRPSFRKI